jgi:hypothetical protein
LIQTKTVAAVIDLDQDSGQTKRIEDEAAAAAGRGGCEERRGANLLL